MQNFKLWEMDCWDGFKKVGTKKGKDGKRVNNCVKEDDEVPKGYHRMPDGSIMKDTDMHEVSAAARKAKKQAYLKKTMKKYGDAAKMGIDAKDVNQRRNAPTRKKSS